MHPADGGAVVGGGAAWFTVSGGGCTEASALVIVSNHQGGRMGSTGRMGSYSIDHGLNLWDHVT